MQTEAIDNLFLELSQVTQATTAKELAMRAALADMLEAAGAARFHSSREEDARTAVGPRLERNVMQHCCRSDQMQHTPGPWTVNYKKFSEVRAENGALVAECKKLTGLVNLQANARLVAAAPELLEALRILYEETVEYIQMNNLLGMDNQCMKLARAALARVGAA